MTLLAGGISIVLAVGFAAGLALVGDAARLDARAQLAADAAALAAAAESLPGAAGDPAAAARSYAGLNGARLLQCICRAGALAAQVTVAIGAASARARAELDPTLLRPAQTTGLHPRLRAAITALLDAAGGALHVVSGYRDARTQEALWAAAVAKHGSPERADDWVARPGTSMHERGLAVDLGGDLHLARRLIVELGLPLEQPLDHEPWHLELAS